MLKLTDTFTCERDAYGWMLHETYIGKDKDNNPKEHIRTTYHPTLNIICKVLLDKLAGKCKSIEELYVLLKDAEHILTLQILDNEN
jgi:hypothetical protein